MRVKELLPILGTIGALASAVFWGGLRLGQLQAEIKALREHQEITWCLLTEVRIELRELANADFRTSGDRSIDEGREPVERCVGTRRSDADRRSVGEVGNGA